MKNERRTATLVGVLYIIGTAAGVASMVASQGVSGTPESLAMLAANSSPATVTALLVLIMGFALTIIPALMYPIIKRESEVLAVGYMIFRGALEMLTYIAIAVCWLVLVVVAGEASGAAGTAMAQYSVLGTLTLRAQEPIVAVQNMVFATGGLMLYYAMYRLRLVPRWLAGWGFIGCVLFFAGGLIGIFADNPVPLLLPLGVQEMVMAAWLIVKGFGPSAARPERGLQPIAA